MMGLYSVPGPIRSGYSRLATDRFAARSRGVLAAGDRCNAAAGDDGSRHRDAQQADVELPWVDLSVRGTVLRAGVTALHDLSIRIVRDAAGHPDLAALARMAAGSVPAGKVLPSPAGDRFYWYAPAPHAADIADERAVLRGLAVGQKVFAALIDRFDAGAHVTAAEKRMLFQLVAGAGPREAAVADRVSFETKRAQLKSLCAKLDCRGQTDLVRRTIGQLVHLLHLSEGRQR